VRQIATGRLFFLEKFGQAPTTAVNFDAFGHSRGLVQILRRAGYDSYIAGRPDPSLFSPPARDFTWVGYDGSEVATHLSFELYNSFLGKAVDKIERFRQENPNQENLLVLWGIGNHGGGPSRLDLERIAELKKEYSRQGIDLEHTTPEAYFALLDRAALPRFEGSLNPMMVGCYTSQSRVKQKHRALENLLFSTEKMVCAAQWQLGFCGNWDKIREAEQALLFSQFHDVLPGSMVKRAESASLRNLDYGLELLNRERMRTFMAFASRIAVEKQEGDIPIMVFNPHPYPLRRIVECEFQLQDQNRSGTHTDFTVWQNGRPVPAQLEKEDSTIPIDWRKKILFEAELAPFAVTTVLCRPVIRERKPVAEQQSGDEITLTGGGIRVQISKKTGWIRSMDRLGEGILREESAKLLVIQGSEDPWGMTVSAYRDVVGAFQLADPQQAGSIAGLRHPIEPVRIIEQGAVRTVVEAIFTYDRSAAIVHYRFAHSTGQLEIAAVLQWMQPDQMVKLSVTPAFAQAACFAQDLFGKKQTKANGEETVGQQWVLLEGRRQALAVINSGLYAHDFDGAELRLTLLHAPAYCAHPVEDRTVLPQDRYLPRIDIGEHTMVLKFLAGDPGELRNTVDTMAQQENEPPFALSFFPAGHAADGESAITLDNRRILLSAATEARKGTLIRLFNSADEFQDVQLKIPGMDVTAALHFTPYEVKTLRIRRGELQEVLLDGSDLN